MILSTDMMVLKRLLLQSSRFNVLSSFCRYQACIQHTYMHAGKIPTNINFLFFLIEKYEEVEVIMFKNPALPNST